jgi:hypothetical protein
VAQSRELARLAERRRLLVAESARLRRQMAEDLAGLRSATVWVERGYAVVQSGRTLWPLLAGVAGLLVARKKRGWIHTARRLWSWWRLGKQLSGLWRSFQTDIPE